MRGKRLTNHFRKCIVDRRKQLPEVKNKIAYGAMKTQTHTYENTKWNASKKEKSKQNEFCGIYIKRSFDSFVGHRKGSCYI